MTHTPTTHVIRPRGATATLSRFALCGVVALTAVAVTAPAIAQSGDRAAQLMERADADGDGALSLDELQANSTDRFAEADKNGDGVISGDEVSELLDERRSRIVSRIMGRVDTDGDGAISADERAAMMEMRFERLDADGDGVVTATELQNARR